MVREHQYEDNKEHLNKRLRPLNELDGDVGTGQVWTICPERGPGLRVLVEGCGRVLKVRPF